MIRKELKYVYFIYEPEKRELYISNHNLRRTEMFSLARFIIRIAQKGGVKWKKRK
jgi:hypothetical protein